jgi:hypothetical protein
VVDCSAESARARRLTGAVSEEASLLLGVRSGSVGFIPAGVVGAGLSWAAGAGVGVVMSDGRWLLGRAATHGRVVSAASRECQCRY